MDIDMTYDCRMLVYSYEPQLYMIKNDSSCYLGRHSIICNNQVTNDKCPTDKSWSVTFGLGCVPCPYKLNCNRCDSPNQCTICIANHTINSSWAKGCCPMNKTWSLTS